MFFSGAISHELIRGPLLLISQQVSYIYGLTAFEDYLYLCSRSDPSEGTVATSELLQIHRFNLTSEPKTLAGLGSARGIRVYHALAQPKGKGTFLINARHAPAGRPHTSRRYGVIGP